MADETKTIETEQQTGENNDTKKPEGTSEPEKKYTDDDVNAISLKNSDKAVKKLLKELGIEPTDEGRAAARELLSKAKADAEAGRSADERNAAQIAKVEAAAAKAQSMQKAMALV